jgi:hypothetical protein
MDGVTHNKREKVTHTLESMVKFGSIQLGVSQEQPHVSRQDGSQTIVAETLRKLVRNNKEDGGGQFFRVLQELRVQILVDFLFELFETELLGGEEFVVGL